MGSILGTLCLVKCCEPCCSCCCGGTKDVPLKAEQLTPDIVTLMLREGGALTLDESVISVKLTKFQDGNGFMSALYRAELKYDPAEKGPASLICKLPPPFLKTRILGTYLNLFEAEISYYHNNLSEVTGMPAPKSYFAKYQGYGRFALLLEDLRSINRITMAEGCPLEHAMTAIVNVAKLHAKFRGRVITDERTKDWILRCDNAGYFKLVGNTFKKAVNMLDEERFKFFGLKMEEVTPFYEAVVSLNNNWDTFVLMLAEGMTRKNKDAMFTRTFNHGDFHSNNMMFDAVGEDGKKSFKILDYQLVIEGDGCRDVVYFNTINLKPEIRREHEKKIIKLYYDEMHKNGAKDFSMIECLISYVIGFCFTLIIETIGQKDTTGGKSEEGKAKINMRMKRINHAVIDWNWLNAIKIVFKNSTNGITQITMDDVKRILPLEYHGLLDPEGELKESKADSTL